MNYYLLTIFSDLFAQAGSYKELVISEKPLTYQEIKKRYSRGIIMKIEILDGFEYENKN